MLVVLEQTPSGPDLNLLTLGGDGVPKPLINTAGSQNNPDISPDGRWIAYESDESGAAEIYVRPFPNVNQGRWQVSPTGGNRPVWAKSGRELFYRAASGRLMVSTVRTTSSFAAESPRALFDGPFFTTFSGAGTNFLRNYDVSLDGSRFVGVSNVRTAGTTTPTAIVVVENWPALLPKELLRR